MSRCRERVLVRVMLVLGVAASASELAAPQKSPIPDAHANLTAGRYLCFVVGDWEEVVPYLALGSDAGLKAVAIKELRGAASADEQAAIGDTWGALAETQRGSERDALLFRAGAWYRQAEPTLEGGLAGLKVKQRLAEVAKLGREIPTLPRTTRSSSPPPPAIAPFDAATAKRHQETWAKDLGVPVEMTNSIGMRFVLIPPGEFDMGSSEAELTKLQEKGKAENLKDYYFRLVLAEAPKHRVRITTPGSVPMGHRRRIPCVTRHRTPGGSTTCAATSGNGVRTGGVSVTTRHPRRMIQPGRQEARSGRAGAVVGTTSWPSFGRRSVAGTTRVFAAVPAAAASSAVWRPGSDQHPQPQTIRPWQPAWEELRLPPGLDRNEAVTPRWSRVGSEGDSRCLEL